MFSIDAGPDGWYSAWWPMPFAGDAVVELVNNSGLPVAGGVLEVRYASDPQFASRLGALGRLGYFNATYRRDMTVNGRDWVFLDTQGRGVFYGVTHSMRGLIPSGNRRNYLEGDERVYVDYSPSPAWYGTGTEDFYESGWYFRDGTTFVMPLIGNPAYEHDGDGAQFDSTGTFRLLTGDAIPFGSRIRFGIEHGPAANEPGDYSSTAYWYGRAEYALRRTDALDPTRSLSRSLHRYSANGESIAQVTSTFEGEDDLIQVTQNVAASTGPVVFRMFIDPLNSGVRLTRLSDQTQPYQAVEVYVNGQFAGEWTQPLGNQSSRWLEDGFEIPATLTRGKIAVDVRLVPVPGSPPWTAGRYESVSYVPAFSDGRPPEKVAGLRAAGGQSNVIDLSWGPVFDNVGVLRYEIFASTSPAVPVNASTRVGESSVPGFRHADLGLQERWYYRVRAVDGSGRVGPTSDVATSVSGNALMLEGEQLFPPVMSTAPVEVQGNCCGVTWSGNAQLWFRAAGAADQATFEFNVPANGTYAITANLTKAIDYGIVQLAVDGTNVGQAFDGFNTPNVTIAPDVSFGSVELTQGPHQLTLIIPGKNAASAGYFAGIDLLRLTKTD